MNHLENAPENPLITINKKTSCYEGFFQVQHYQLQHTLYRGGMSPNIDREVVIRPNAVGVILYDPIQRSVIMVEQFRVGAFTAGVNAWLLEIVAGLVHPGETPLEVAKREALEETNVEIHDCESAYRYLASPGGSSEEVTLCVARVDSNHIKTGDIHGLPEEGEDIRVRVFSTQAIYDLLDRGKLSNGLTLIAIQWLKLNEAELIKKWR